MKPGQRVRVISAPDRVGVLTDDIQVIGEKKRWMVKFPETNARFPEKNLEVIEDSETIESLLSSGKFGGVKNLRGAITHARLTGRLADVIYSMEATNTEFYPYQFKPVLNFLESPSNGILIADEVGLGKTIEAGLIWTELRAREDAKKLLILCPAVLRNKWRDELSKRFGITAQICGATEVLDQLQKYSRASEEFAIIASFQGIRPPKGWEEEDSIQKSSAQLARYIQDKSTTDTLFDCVIIDEAHYMRNPTKQTHQLGHLIRSATKNIVLLSATPIQLKSDDLYYLLNIIDSENFAFKTAFESVLVANKPLMSLATKLRTKECSQEELREYIDNCLLHPLLNSNRQLQELKSSPPSNKTLNEVAYRVRLANRVERINLLGSVINRTRKRDVRENRVIRIPHAPQITMTEIERTFYNSVTDSVSEYCDQYDLFKGFILTIPQRQMCSSMPASIRSWKKKSTFHNEETEEILSDMAYGMLEENNFDYNINDKSESGPLITELMRLAHEIGDYEALKENDSKYRSLLEILKNYWQEHPGGKIVLFSFFRETLSYLQERLADEDINAILLMGGMGDQKEKALDDFENNNDTNILLASEVVSEGVDLQFSSMLINYDLPWNPMRVEQRIGRIDRIGQKKDRILIWNLFYEDTLDDRIYNRLFSRLGIFKQALGDLEAILGEKIQQLTRELFSHKLTEEEKNEQIDQTATAIANEKQNQEALESQAAGLAAHGDYILNKVSAAKEMRRFIDGDTLWIYVRDFLKRKYKGSNLVEKEQDPLSVDIALSIEARTDFSNFVQTANAQSKTRMHSSIEGDPTRCKFYNQVDFSNQDYEVINQYHPLVRFAAKHTSSNDFHQVVATRINKSKVKHIASGMYLILAKFWSTSGAKTTEILVYRGINIHSGEVLTDSDSELTMMSAVSEGKDWPTAVSDVNAGKAIAGYQHLENMLDEQFDDYCRQMKLENEDRIEFLIATLNGQMDKQIASKKEAINKLYLKNNIKMIPLFEAQIQKIESNRARLTYEHKQKRTISNEPRDVILSAVYVE